MLTRSIRPHGYATLLPSGRNGRSYCGTSPPALGRRWNPSRARRCYRCRTTWPRCGLPWAKANNSRFATSFDATLRRMGGDTCKTFSSPRPSSWTGHHRKSDTCSTDWANTCGPQKKNTSPHFCNMNMRTGSTRNPLASRAEPLSIAWRAWKPSTALFSKSNAAWAKATKPQRAASYTNF